MNEGHKVLFPVLLDKTEALRVLEEKSLYTFESRVRQRSGSYYVAIPASMARAMGLHHSDQVVVGLAKKERKFE